MTLFLYGTLLPSQLPVELVSIGRRMTSLGRGRLRGRLYDLGSYPGAILDNRSEGFVVGEVFELPDDHRLIAPLDAYEGFDPDDPPRSLYVRRIAPVTLDDGRTVDCSVYEYNRGTTGLDPIPGGSWLASRAT